MDNKIRILIFSRDRAMQVDGALRSFFLHCQDPEAAGLSVIYRATTAQHAAQYRRLEAEYEGRGVRWTRENHFRRDVLNRLWPFAAEETTARLRIVRLLPRRMRMPLHWLLPLPPGAIAETILFLVDDNLFVGDFSLKSMVLTLEETPNALGYSLRLGRNTSFCFTHQRAQALPEFTAINEALAFDWTQADQDFGYPLELSSSLYRWKDIFPLVYELPFHNPNELEGQMAAQAERFVSQKPLLLCSKQSATFCNPANLVQTVSQNRTGQRLEYSSGSLANLFDEGYRIDAAAFNGLIPEGCHQLVDLAFHKPATTAGG